MKKNFLYIKIEKDEKHIEIIIIIHMFYGKFNNVVCWRPVFKAFPVCVFVLLRGVEREAQTQSGLEKNGTLRERQLQLQIPVL